MTTKLAAQIAFTCSFLNFVVGAVLTIGYHEPVYGIYFAVAALWFLGMAFFVLNVETN